LGKYVTPAGEPPVKVVPAVIDLRRYDRDSYYAAVRKVHSGNAVRDARKSDRAGFVCHQCARPNYIPDIHEINTSKSVHSGGEMRAAYHRTVEELGGAPKKLSSVPKPKCPVHHRFNWGIFEPKPGYTQGEVVTDEKLLGYVSLKRYGNFAIYSSILGHGDYLSLGIMYRLHYAIMDWIFEEREKSLSGLDLIMYGAINSGGAGLMLWKKRALFEGVSLVAE
jgi:hypothetical protein